MDLVPDAGQISQVMSQAAGPAFVLGAVAAFIDRYERRTHSDGIIQESRAYLRGSCGWYSALRNAHVVC
jgi:hypothetical protein